MYFWDSIASIWTISYWIFRTFIIFMSYSAYNAWAYMKHRGNFYLRHSIKQLFNLVYTRITQYCFSSSAFFGIQKIFHVFLLRSRIAVLGVTAPSVIARMIPLHTFWHRSIGQFPGHNVSRTGFFSTQAKNAMAKFACRSLPGPALIWTTAIYKFPEANSNIFWWSFPFALFRTILNIFSANTAPCTLKRFPACIALQLDLCSSRLRLASTGTRTRLYSLSMVLKRFAVMLTNVLHLITFHCGVCGAPGRSRNGHERLRGLARLYPALQV